MTDSEELAELCKVLGCTTKPGVALRFAKELRRDLYRAHERHVELLRTWDDASPTERQELDRLRRGWGPSTPTERQARHSDLCAAMRAFEKAMTALDVDSAEGDPDEQPDDEIAALYQTRAQAAHDALTEGYRACIALLHALPDLRAPDMPTHVSENAP
jgi:hypothetical protein